MCKEITLHFYGYTWEEYVFQISRKKGIFVVYKGKLDCEGFIELHDLLYVGYHSGINEIFCEDTMGQIKRIVSDNERVFLSYAEVPEGEDGKVIEALMVGRMNPQINRNRMEIPSNIRLVCEGNCALFPPELLK